MKIIKNNGQDRVIDALRKSISAESSLNVRWIASKPVRSLGEACLGQIAAIT